jgi:predicted ATPase
VGANRMIAGRFEVDLQSPLGRGGMADVYRGTDTLSGETVAIKILKPEIIAHDPELVARFVREGEALRGLDHPNIVKMIAAVEEEGRHILVMEHVAGGSLEALIQEQGPLPLGRALEITLDLADALTRAHRLGVVHRDLKPGNVLLAEDGTPRLTDFGMAHLEARSRLTQSDVVMGTLHYLSPEACDLKKVDTRADIWALGVMLYEMLTGERPFRGDIPTAIIAAILTQPVPDLSQLCPDLPVALVDLVYRMLEKDRQGRIPSARLVGAELEAILLAMGEEEWVVAAPSAPRTSALATDRFATPTPEAHAPRHNLPVQATPFVGREAELAELARLTGDPEVRLLTILGAGGMGKTRLALQAAEAQLGNFEGICFVPLAPLRSAEAIVPTMVGALALPVYEGIEPRQQLLAYLRRKRVLLVMDNYEHLLEGVGLMSEILGTAPAVKILATSRARLNVGGEHRFHLEGMDFPDWETPEDALEYSAVKLFMASARRARPGFELEAGDLKYVARICRLVEGMPLGIRLAAAWVEMLSPEEIAAEISQNLDFLESDLRDVPERQRSLRAVFDYSWDLLTEREREVLQGASVFRGGFTREAAQSVTGASLRELMSLVNKSLLHRNPAGRYELHDLTGSYTAEKFQASPAACTAVRDRHSAFYAAALGGWGEELKGPRQHRAIEEMELESENVRAAWDWAAERGLVEQLDQSLEGLCLFYWLRARYPEGEGACRTAVDELAKGQLAGVTSEDSLWVLARTLAWQGHFHRLLGRFELADQLAQESLEMLEGPELADRDTRAGRAFTLMQMGYSHWLGSRGPMRVEEARQSYEQSLALYRALDDRWWVAIILNSLGMVAHNVGAYDEAERAYQEGLALQQALGNQAGTSNSLSALGVLAWVRGRLEEAVRRLQESVAIVREIDDRPGTALGGLNFMGLARLGEALMRSGELAEGHSLIEESVRVYNDLGDLFNSTFASLFLCEAKAHLGRYEEARALGQAGLAFWRGSGLWPVGFACFGSALAALAVEGYADAQDLLAESSSCFQEFGHRENLGWALAVLGYAARGLGQASRARAHLCEALGITADIGAFMPFLYGLPAAALLLADQGQAEWAVELYAMASRYGFVANSRWFEDVAGKHLTGVAAALPPEAVAAALLRGRARDVEATVKELLIELGC